MPFIIHLTTVLRPQSLLVLSIFLFHPICFLFGVCTCTEARGRHRASCSVTVHPILWGHHLPAPASSFLELISLSHDPSPSGTPPSTMNASASQQAQPYYFPKPTASDDHGVKRCCYCRPKRWLSSVCCFCHQSSVPSTYVRCFPSTGLREI